MRSFWTSFTAFLLSASVSAGSLLAACPYCGVTPPSLAEQVASHDAVVLGKFLEGDKPNRQKELSGATRFEIVKIVKGADVNLTQGGTLSLERYRDGSKGDLVLIMGNKDADAGDALKWTELINMTEESFDYMVKAPGLDVPVQQRLVYFLGFLEHPNSVVAADAFSEFAISAYKDIVPLAPLMEPDRIRSWLENPETPPDRVLRTGFYGLILGLCGDEEDGEFLKNKLLTSSADYQFGIDGMTSGYILLTGKQGFNVLEEAMILNPESSQTDLFQVLQSLRFIWTYDRERIPQADLFSAMRAVLKRPEIADMAIIDLARWKDWEAMDQVVGLYEKEGFNDPPVKRAIIRYLMTAKGSAELSPSEGADSHVEKAQKHLERLKEADPRLFKEVERYFFE